MRVQREGRKGIRHRVREGREREREEGRRKNDAGSEVGKGRKENKQ